MTIHKDDMVSLEEEAGRREYADGVPYDFLRSVWWKRAWMRAANEAAIAAKTAGIAAAFAMGVMEFAEARTGTDRAVFAVVAACSAIGLLAVIGIIVG